MGGGVLLQGCGTVMSTFSNQQAVPLKVGTSQAGSECEPGSWGWGCAPEPVGGYTSDG